MDEEKPQSSAEHCGCPASCVTLPIAGSGMSFGFLTMVYLKV